MKSYQQQYLAIHANLLAELRELQRLRKRVKNAELLPLRTAADGRRTKKGLVQPKKPSPSLRW